MRVVDIWMGSYPIPFGLALTFLQGKQLEGGVGGCLGVEHFLVRRRSVLAEIELPIGFVGR